jgi:hypothetical protein
MSPMTAKTTMTVQWRNMMVAFGKSAKPCLGHGVFHGQRACANFARKWDSVREGSLQQVGACRPRPRVGAWGGRVAEARVEATTYYPISGLGTAHLFGAAAIYPRLRRLCTGLSVYSSGRNSRQRSKHRWQEHARSLT